MLKLGILSIVFVCLLLILLNILTKSLIILLVSVNHAYHIIIAHHNSVGTTELWSDVAQYGYDEGPT